MYKKMLIKRTTGMVLNSFEDPHGRLCHKTIWRRFHKFPSRTSFCPGQSVMGLLQLFNNRNVLRAAFLAFATGLTLRCSLFR